MVTRAIQLVLAVGGMALLLRFGLVRSPGFGEESNLHPVMWVFHPVPFVLGIVMLAVALGLIFVKEGE